MIGLPGDNGKPILRAYSIASPNWDEELEFYSIKVPDGPLTSRLQHIQPGDQIILRPKPVGTLVLDALLPGKRLWLLATGTGIAPFASLMRDPETYERYEQVIMMHTCRDPGRAGIRPRAGRKPAGRSADRRIRRRQADLLPDHHARGDRRTWAGSPTTSPAGKVFADLGLPPISPETDRAMVCGSAGASTSTSRRCSKASGLREGANSDPREYVVEKAFVGDGI